MKRPLLSICIPTYNRAQYLKQSLESYVLNVAFDDEVEIVISDNASSDETKIVAESYSRKFNNIKYFRNDENLKDSNFCLALNRATGQYVKLMNDNLVVTTDGLAYLKETVRRCLDNKEPVFFTNGIYSKNQPKETCFESFDSFIVNMSFVVTAILTFGAWREDWLKVENPTKYTQFMLNQDDWIYQIVEHKPHGYICRGQYCQGIVIDKAYRKGYNWFKVHVDNYYSILQPYIARGLVSNKNIKREKEFYLKNLKSELVITYLYNICPEFQFDLSNASYYLWKSFKKIPLFYVMLITLPLWGGYKVLIYLLKKKHL